MSKETLTKENFWNEIYLKYPNATKIFCGWIDEYKISVGWESLFNAGISLGANEAISKSKKYHELPYAIQQGIWIQFAQEILPTYFEQPEYIYSFDLEEDIKTVLSELEEIISEIDKIIR